MNNNCDFAIDNAIGQKLEFVRWQGALMTTLSLINPFDFFVQKKLIDELNRQNDLYGLDFVIKSNDTIYVKSNVNVGIMSYGTILINNFTVTFGKEFKIISIK